MISKNMRAFLEMIAWAELGPLLAVPGSDNGYNIIVGSHPSLPVIFFDDYSDHPRVRVKFSSRFPPSSAVGRYQMLRRTYDNLKRQGHMSSMHPPEQDRGAIALIRGRRAEPAVEAGHIVEAIHLCRKEWASLAGAGYGQNERKLKDLLEKYTQAGGTIA